MADRLAVDARDRPLGAEVTVGVDLHLDAAVGEDALRHHGDHVDAVDLATHDEGRGLVVRIGGAGPDGGDEGGGLTHHGAVPVERAGPEGNDAAAVLQRMFQHDVRVDAHKQAGIVGVAVAGPALAEPDVAHDRAGVAADLVRERAGAFGDGGHHGLL